MTTPSDDPRRSAAHEEATRPVLPQALDFRAECEALHDVLAAAPATAWQEPTQFQGWTFDDIVAHLNMFDYAAELAARGREELQAYLGPLLQRLGGGMSFAQAAREWRGDRSGQALLAQWREQYLRLADVYAALDPNQRLAWAGPDMNARSFMSARQMETWSHGQAVFDALGLERVEHDRLRNIAVMGVNTFGWTFTVNRREVPGSKPYVRLTSPSGATWEWNDTGSADRIEGSAVDFCRVVTQTRNVLDTDLRVTGEVAREWMALAQCFAGPPVRPPAPGTRFKRVR
jgi:uncharacterized protein (TIGR03084 family)